MSSRIRSLVALVTLVLAMPVALATNVGPAAAAPVPRDGFSDVLVASGLGAATAFVELPDDRMFVTSQSGQLWLLNADGTKPASPALTLSPCTNSEQGLLGVAVHPDVASNGYLYLFYTKNDGGCFNRVSRFTLSGSTVNPASELVLIDDIPSTAGNHNGGDVQVGKDNFLYVSTGDNADAATAPLNTNMHGKILRIGLDGSVPSSNPFVSTSGSVPCAQGAPGNAPCQEIVARGLRNPFRIAPDVNASTTRFFVMDVGDGTSEEIDELTIGANYGWPVREGFCVRGSRTNCDPQPVGLQPPVFDYAHSTGCGSITGGAFVPSGWPARYLGGFIYGDFVCQKIFALVPDGQGGYTNELFTDTAGRVVHMRSVQRGGTWSIYYTTIAGELRRITSNADPGQTAKSRFTPLSPKRVLDTRDGVTGYSGRKPAAGDTISVKVTGGTTGVPADAVAVALNLTGTDATAAGFVTLWPTGEARPTTSVLNLASAGDTGANAVIARVGGGGSLNLFTQTGAHLVADITGYWTATETSNAGRYEPAASPLRLLDTRSGNGAPTGIVGAGGSLDLQVTGRGGAGGVPATGISAVALVVTVVDTTASGFVTVWPTGQARPLASTVNPVGARDIRSNLVMLPLGTDGKVSLYTLQATHLVVDIAGWFTDGTADLSSSGLMIATSPIRVTDTRNNVPFGRLNGGDTGVLDYSALTSNAKAIATNLTVDATQSPGFLTAWPADQTIPTASNVNWGGANQTRPALALSSLAADGEVAYRPNVATHFVVDVAAWFVA